MNKEMVEMGDSEYKESATTNDNVNDNGDDAGYESWTEGNWCWVVTSSSSSSPRGTSIHFPISKQKKTSADDTNNDNDVDDNETDEDEVVVENDDEYDDDDNDDDEDDDANSLYNEDEVGDEDLDDADGNNDDVDYESWTEGNWCLLLPNTTTSVLTPTKKKTTRTIRVTRRTRTIKTHLLKGVRNERWNKMFWQLVIYKEKHQTTNVPRRYQEDPPLGHWVKRQREYYKNEMVIKYRVNLLNSIGFVWKLQDHVPWIEMYQKLIAYKKQYKTTSVPQCDKEDQNLGGWVDTQRQFCKNKELSIERINYLDSIGFVWKIRVPWIEMYERIVAYKQR